MKEAARNGIRIIGADREYQTGHLSKVAMIENEDGTQLKWSETAKDLFHTSDAMKDRDLYAAEVVKATRDEGKYIVYGGAAHSRKEGAVSQDPSAGVDDLLNIPSIDFISEESRSAEIADNLVDDLGHEVLAAFPWVARMAYENIVGTISPRSVIEYQRDGKSSFVVTNFASERYAERDIELTDNPDRRFDKTHLNIEMVGQAMQDAGVCKAPPDGKLIRGLEDVPDVRDMVNAQYPSR